MISGKVKRLKLAAAFVAVLAVSCASKPATPAMSPEETRERSTPAVPAAPPGSVASTEPPKAPPQPAETKSADAAVPPASAATKPEVPPKEPMKPAAQGESAGTATKPGEPDSPASVAAEPEPPVSANVTVPDAAVTGKAAVPQGAATLPTADSVPDTVLAAKASESTIAKDTAPPAAPPTIAMARPAVQLPPDRISRIPEGEIGTPPVPIPPEMKHLFPDFPEVDPSRASTPQATKSADTLLATARLPPAALPKVRPFQEIALAGFSSSLLPNGIRLMVMRQPGRRMVEARIALAAGAGPIPQSKAGLEAMALALAIKGALGSKPGAFESALGEAGAKLALVPADDDIVGIDLACPLESIFPALELVCESLRKPAMRQADFERVLRDFRFAERRESSDPLQRGATALRKERFAGQPSVAGQSPSISPRGTAASLATITLADLTRFWSQSAIAERLHVALVGDLEPALVAACLTAGFGALPSKAALNTGDSIGAAATPPAAATFPFMPGFFRADPIPGSKGLSYLLGEFAAPSLREGDFAAMLVALTMLDDLLATEIRGLNPIAGGAWTALSAQGRSTAGIVVFKATEPRSARAGVGRAIAALAAGECLAPGGGGATPVDSALSAYKARTVTKLFGGSAESPAARMVADSTAGGDGSAWFRVADRIEAVEADDIIRVTRRYLAESPSAWIALGDGALVGTLRGEDFSTPGRRAAAPTATGKSAAIDSRPVTQ